MSPKGKKPAKTGVIIIARPIHDTAPAWWPCVQWVTLNYYKPHDALVGWSAGVDVTSRAPATSAAELAREWRNDYDDKSIKWEIAIATATGEIEKVLYRARVPQKKPRKKPAAKKKSIPPKKRR